MKSLVRLSAALSLAGSVLVGSLVTTSTRALALPEAQVMERLRPVPVFTLTDNQGAPLVASPAEGQPPVAGVFISRQDAQTFLTNLQRENPSVASGIQVVPVSLAEVYQLAIAQRNRQERLEFAFIPAQQQVEAAVSVLRQNGEDPSAFEGVPVFIARTTGENGGYLTVRQGEQQVIPMFLSRQELQAMLDRLQQVQPQIARTISVQVVPLEGLIQTLQESNNQELNQILLIPPRDSIEFIRSLQPRQNAPAGQNRPQVPAGQNRPQPNAPRR